MQEDQPLELKRLDWNELALLSKDEVRAFIAEVETWVKTKEQCEIPTRHFYSKGVYAKEVTLPKGGLIVGAIHKHENLNVLTKGELSLLSIDGVIRVKAPYTVVSSPGVKRLAYVHEEACWTTFLGTDMKDPEEIESEFTVKDYAEVIEKSLEEPTAQGELECL